ncbi:type II secretion system F family protein [Candidatus Micrarchaeota archaeon]|nr:type II secretion system F family protein [Candidatus Micrarchaeota archaeon]
MGIDDIYKTVGRIMPRDRIRRLDKLIEMSGLNILPEAFTGLVIVIASLLTVFIFLLLIQLYPFSTIPNEVAKFIISRVGIPQALARAIGIALVFILSALLCFVGSMIASYSYLILQADGRRKQVEQVLPDFLIFAAANVRAGMPIDQAMWNAAKPDFGLFSKEIETMAKRTFGGEPFASALDRLGARFDSKITRRTISLIKHGIATGGEMAEILERTASDIREMQILRKEISTAMLMYVIFIVFAAFFGAPFLYAISLKLVVTLTYIWQQIPSIQDLPGGVLPNTPIPPSITEMQFLLFSIGSALVTSIFASLTVSVIQTGDKKEGLKYIPIFLAVSLIVFFIIGIGFDQFFAGILRR